MAYQQYRSRKVGFWHIYASRILTSQRFSSSTKLPMFALQSVSISFLFAHKNSICVSAVTKILFIGEKRGGILISISMSNLLREKWENLNEYICTWMWESGPKCRYVKARSGSADIFISAFCLIPGKTRTGEYAADEGPIIYFFGHRKLHFL